MKKSLLILVSILCCGSLVAQHKPRPDAFPPERELVASKAITMASTVDEMASWNRYPTYETYLAMMQQWADDYPTLCTIDTIGTSLQGRLILSAHIRVDSDDNLHRPQFFYSSTIHGDEVTGYVMMLHLIDTLLSSYGINQLLTDLVNSTDIYINPLANPDGTYYGGNHTLQGAVRYNANGVDLNRNYPDPFAVVKSPLQQENEAMIAYVSAHNFKLSANLHGGSEVMNYPWDCFTSLQNPHPASDWWVEVGKRFVDTCRLKDSNHVYDVTSSGVVAGGDWYVIHGGRQDYMNYYHGCLELTMEISTAKLLSSNQLPSYWRLLASSLINYIAEIHSLPSQDGIAPTPDACHGQLTVVPNPVRDNFTVEGLPAGATVEIYDLEGRLRAVGTNAANLPAGLYILRAAGQTAPIVKM